MEFSILFVTADRIKSVFVRLFVRTAAAVGICRAQKCVRRLSKLVEETDRIRAEIYSVIFELCVCVYVRGVCVRGLFVRLVNFLCHLELTRLEFRFVSLQSVFLVWTSFLIRFFVSFVRFFIFSFHSFVFFLFILVVMSKQLVFLFTFLDILQFILSFFYNQFKVYIRQFG